MKAVVMLLMPAEEFRELPEPADKRLELVACRIVDKSLLVARSGLVKGNLLTAMGDFTDRHNIGIGLIDVGAS